MGRLVQSAILSCCLLYDGAEVSAVERRGEATSLSCQRNRMLSSRVVVVVVIAAGRVVGVVCAVILGKDE